MKNTATSPEVAQMHRRKATIEKRLAELDGINHREAVRYPSWAITCRSGRAYRQRQKGAAERMERSIDRAKEYTALCEEKRELERRIEDITSGKREHRSATRAAANLQAVIQFTKIKPGNEVMIPGGNTVKVAKKNAKSIITISGSRWSIAEVAGVSGSEVDELLAQANANAANVAPNALSSAHPAGDVLPRHP